MRKKVIVWNKGSKTVPVVLCDSITDSSALLVLTWIDGREGGKGNEVQQDGSLLILVGLMPFMTIHLPQLRKLSSVHLWGSFKTVKGIK